MDLPYSWQQSAWYQLTEMTKKNVLPPALIYSGERNCAMLEFSLFFIQWLFCLHQLNLEVACGNCRNCQLISNSSHPDVEIIKAENGQISIDEIRALKDKLIYTSFYNKYKVIIVDSLDDMSLSAKTALLKTLEEPPPKSILLLLSYNRIFVPTTIRSRCLEIVFPSPKFEDVKNIMIAKNVDLKDIQILSFIADNKPFLALEYKEEGRLKVFISVLNWFSNYIKEGILPDLQIIKELDLKAFVHYLRLIIMDLIRIKAGIISENERLEDYFLNLKDLANKFTIHKLFKYFDYLNQRYKDIAIFNIKLNKSLVIDCLLSTSVILQ